MESDIYSCWLSCQALRDGNKLAQMEEAPLFPGESIKAIGKFNMYHLLIGIYEMYWYFLSIGYMYVGDQLDWFN